MSDEDKEVEELRAMMAAGPPSMRGTPPARQRPAVAEIDFSDDFMSAHMKNLRAANTNDRMNHTVGHQAHMPPDNFLQSHLRKVKAVTSPSKAWQGTASQMPADNLLQAHYKKVTAESGPKVFKSTKLYGVAPQGVKTDGYMMAFVSQVEKERKGGVSSIGMVPKVGGDSIEAEFLKKVAENSKGGESSIGVAPKVTGDSYMAAHSKKLLEENKPNKKALGVVTHMPADSYMMSHLKNLNEINTHNKETQQGAKAALPADSFMIDFHKKAKEANAVKPIPHKPANVPADSYLLAQMKEIKEMNDNTHTSAATIHEKPTIGTDDFTMSVLRKAQKDVMSY